jgi:hypothetical protein
VKASQRIYRSADGEIVAEDDPRAAFLVVAAGKDVPEEYEAQVRKLYGPKTASDEPVKKEAAKPANKAVKKSTNK